MDAGCASSNGVDLGPGIEDYVETELIKYGFMDIYLHCHTYHIIDDSN